MYFLVNSTPDSKWRDLLPMLEAFGCQSAPEDTVRGWQEKVTTASLNGSANDAARQSFGTADHPIVLPLSADAPQFSLQTALKKLDGATLLSFYTRPEPVLARAMAEDQSPAEALKKWQTEAIRVLEHHQQSHGRAVLMDVEAARKHPADFHDVCTRYLPTNEAATAPETPAASETQDDIHRVIAAHMVAQSEEIQDLVNELEASATPLGPYQDPVEIDAEKLLLALQKPKRKNSELQEENELLLLQLHQVQEELESYFLESRNENAKRLKTEKKLSEKTKAMEAEKALSGKIKAEKRRLRKRLKQTQQSLARHKRQLAKTERLLKLIRHSLSWRLTAPLRVTKRLLTGQPAR